MNALDVAKHDVMIGELASVVSQVEKPELLDGNKSLEGATFIFNKKINTHVTLIKDVNPGDTILSFTHFNSAPGLIIEVGPWLLDGNNGKYETLQIVDMISDIDENGNDITILEVKQANSDIKGVNFAHKIGESFVQNTHRPGFTVANLKPYKAIGDQFQWEKLQKIGY